MRVEDGERERHSQPFGDEGCRIAKEQTQMQYWRAWAPILARVFATALALLGLAGIGWAARASHDLAALTTAPLSFGLAQITGSGVVASPGRAAAAPPLPCAPAAPPDAGAAESATPSPSAEPRAKAGLSAGHRASPGVSAEGRVILNVASAAELQRLPGIGAKRAAAIVALRQRLGRLRRPSDLLRVKGIGPRLLERMLPMIALDANVELPP